MTEEELGAVVLSEVAIPARVGTGIGGFLALMLSVYIAVRQLRGSSVGLLGFGGAQLLCLTTVALFSAEYRIAPHGSLTLYGLALPAFLSIFPSVLVQGVQLVPSAIRGLLGGTKRWRAAAPALLMGCLAAAAVFAGGNQLGASGDTAQFHEQLAFNVFCGVRAVVYAGGGVLLYAATLRPLDTLADVARAQGLGLGLLLMIVLGEIAGVGVGMYTTAMFFDSMASNNATTQIEYMAALLRVEHMWGIVAALCAAGAWGWMCRTVWVTTAGETPKWGIGERVALAATAAAFAMLMFGGLSAADYETIYNLTTGQ